MVFLAFFYYSILFSLGSLRGSFFICLFLAFLPVLVTLCVVFSLLVV